MRIFLVVGPGDPFLDPRTKIWTQDLKIGPGLARGGFWIQNAGWKNMVLRGNYFENGDYGISRDQNGLYGTQEAFGKASFPPNPFKKLFPSTFADFGKFGEGPPGHPVYLLLALCGPIAPYPTPDQPPEVACMLLPVAVRALLACAVFLAVHAPCRV